MMVFFKDGRVLVYNHANHVDIENGLITLFKDSSKFFIAKINLDVIERIDGVRPCRIYKRKNKLEK